MVLESETRINPSFMGAAIQLSHERLAVGVILLKANYPVR